MHLVPCHHVPKPFVGPLPLAAREAGLAAWQGSLRFEDKAPGILSLPAAPPQPSALKRRAGPYQSQIGWVQILKYICLVPGRLQVAFVKACRPLSSEIRLETLFTLSAPCATLRSSSRFCHVGHRLDFHLSVPFPTLKRHAQYNQDNGTGLLRVVYLSASDSSLTIAALLLLPTWLGA